MYQPEAFRPRDPDLARDLVRDFPFATLLTAGGTEINHLPLLLRDDLPGAAMVLEGHVARGNPVASAAENAAPVTALFHGPETYVSPRWYVSEGQVPTWNYAVVHASGRFRPIEDPTEVLTAMERLVRRFEGESGWSMTGLPPAARDGMLGAIRYFRIEIESFEAKFKLSQNRATADRASVERHLAESNDPRHAEMLRYLKRANTGK
ncbi:MAG: FMN-binding negative transcriptional regulator [Bdellovibrionales bacterium]|nr:FMN-binding negative transcriptional regulator [Bdellovibrionales bacterium]